LAKERGLGRRSVLNAFFKQVSNAFCPPPYKRSGETSTIFSMGQGRQPVLCSLELRLSIHDRMAKVPFSPKIIQFGSRKVAVRSLKHGRYTTLEVKNEQANKTAF
jgi:hypothetical protein